MNDNFQLEYFQQKVLEEYELMKSFEKTFRFMGKDPIEKKGCLTAPLELLAQRFVERTLKKEQKKRHFDEAIRESGEILQQKEISNKICETIANITRNDILTEQKFVRELTAALYKSELANRFVIPENPVLYAMMAGKIFKTGLEKFCAEKE